MTRGNENTLHPSHRTYLFCSRKQGLAAIVHLTQANRRSGQLEFTHVEEGLSLIPHGCVVPVAEGCISTRAATSLQAAVVDESCRQKERRHHNIATSQPVGSSNTAVSETADFINDIGNMVNNSELNLERLSNDQKYYFLKHDFVPSGIKCLRSGPK